MPQNPSLARASSTTPLPTSASTLPEGFLNSITDEVAVLQDVQDAHVLVESLLGLAAAVGERPSIRSVGATLRLINGTFALRMKAVEELLASCEGKASKKRG